MKIIKCRGVWKLTARGDITLFHAKKPNHGPKAHETHYRTVSRVVVRAPGLSRAYRVTPKGREYVREMMAEREAEGNG